MKKTFMALTIASLFIAGAAQAQDHSTTVNINGQINGDHTECSVFTSKSTITLSGLVADLPKQGEHATTPVVLDYNIMSNSAESCIGKVAVVLHGEADNADGTTLANSDTSPEAAKGIGIGLFDTNLDPITINSNQITSNTNAGQIYLQAVKLNGQDAVEGTVHGSLTLDIVRL